MICGLTEDDVIARLRAVVRRYDTHKAYAQAHGISEQYLSDVLTRKRAPGRRILDAIGFERVTYYQEKQS